MSLRSFNSRLLIASIFILATLSGCSTLKGCMEGEPPAVSDAEPPADYHPVFLHSLADINTSTDNKPQLSLERVELDSTQQVSITMILNDTLGAFLYGASQAGQRKIWCEVVDKVGDEQRVVKDFSVREQTERDRIPHAIAVVIDNSGSMGEDRALATQDAADYLIGLKQPEDMMAFVRYDSRVQVEVPLTSDAGTLKSQLQHNGLMGFGGGTAIANGINAGLDVLSTVPPGYQRCVVVITDGIDNSSTMSTESVIDRARQINTAVHTIDFGNGVAGNYMNNIARKTGGLYQKMYRTKDFGHVFEDAYRKIKNKYVLSFKTDMYGDHAVSIKLCLPKDSSSVTAEFSNSPKVGDLSLVDAFFDSNKSDLKAESKPAIDKVYKLMRAFPSMRIEIRGHTDANNNTGDAEHNKKLSQKRADAVLNELVKRGIQASRITAKGYGDSVPVADNSTPEGRARNRRTEFLIVAN